jgi:hypothetical protein
MNEIEETQKDAKFAVWAGGILGIVLLVIGPFILF